MAILVPPKPLVSTSQPVMRVFRLLKNLSDEFTVRHLLAEAEGPQFFVLWRDRHAFLVTVAETTQALAETAFNPSLLPGDEQITADQLYELGRFAPLLDGRLPRDLAVRCLVVFPNVDDATVDQVERLRSEQDGVAYLGLRQTPAGEFSRHLESLAAEPISEPMLFRLREHFDAGSRICETPARLTLSEREGKGELPPAFLDLDQENLAKLEVELPPEAERMARSFETRLVTGPAGCGKSLVLLHRALFAARLNSRSRLLILTHNKPINAELRRRAMATAPEGARVLWLNFFRWARRCLPEWPREILSPRKVVRRVAELKDGGEVLGRLTPTFIEEEFRYLRDLGIASLDEYLALERSGRLMALTAKPREAIWSLLETYRADLARRGESDWHEVALRFHEFAREQPGRVPSYDFIFIDEAQFFAKVWFTPVLAALAPGAQLFLAADPTQGFLRRRESWLAAGIDVRGRANRLSKPYRSTRAILEFARDLLDRRRPLHPDVATDDLDPPSASDLAAIEDAGERPHLLHIDNPQEAIARAVKEVAKLRERAPHLAGHVLLLHADSYAASDLVRALRHRLGDGAVGDLNASDTPPGDAFCSVSNLMAATGLEAAVVFLLGVDELLDRENDPRLDANARAELAADHTRLLYMACTRAARRLVVLAKGLGE